MQLDKLKLIIQSGDKRYYPVVEDGITLEQDRIGSPSKLSFKVLKDPNLSFNEGDAVLFYYNDIPMFLGYVFTKSRDKEHLISVTAYDQMRYMKNKYSYVFNNKTASQIIKSMCNDFGIKTGEIEDTGYPIPSMVFENKSIMDIAYDALDESMVNTNEMYVMYDNFGSIELKSLANMATNVLIDDETAEDYDYKSSIDKDTYNKIVLYYVDENTNDRIPYSAKDDSNINQWGLLQYFEEVKNPSIGQSKANALLKIHNKKSRELKIKNAFGNPNVRAGSLVVVKLNLGDVMTNNYMLVEKCTHKFENDMYTMELTMNGNWDGV